MFSSLSKEAAALGLNVSEVGLLIFAALIAVGLYGEYRKEERWRRLSDTFELLVVIGVVGEVIFDGLIFGYSGRLSALQDQAVAAAIASAGKANEAAEKANKAAEEANRVAKEANGLATKATELADKLSKINDGFEKKYGPLVMGLTPRDVYEGDLRTVMRGIPRGNIIIVRLDDAEPRNFADKIAVSLRHLNFSVQTEDLKATSALTGVIVCERSSNDLKIVKAMNRAGMGAKLMQLNAKDRPDFCDMLAERPNSGGFVIFGRPAMVPVPVTVIFVGQRPLPSQ